MRAELRTINGVVEVFVNGARQSRMWGRLALPGQNAPEKLDQYIDAGIDVYFTNVDLEWNNGWNGDDTYDYRHYEIHLDRILAVKPDIKLVLFVGYSGSAPYKWCRANEDQLALLSNGDRLRMGSFASERWLEDSNRAMAAFVKHFQDSPYCENIIGINPIMYSNEWHTPASRSHPPLDDYSAPMEEHFRAWLQKKYEGDADALRASWQEEDICFDTVEIPGEARRLRIGLPPLPFGEKDMAVFDYETCLNEARERFIIQTCRAVKEASGGTLLTTLSRREQSLAMLNSEWVDIHHGPYAYLNRKLGNVNGYSRRSLDLHGKLGMYQIDTGTHVMPRTGGDPLGIGWIWPGPHRLADNEWESLEILERDVCKAIADNRYVYWNDGGPGWMFPVVNHGVVTYGRHWFDTPAIRKLIARCKKLVDQQAALQANSSARVALIGADYQQHHLGSGGPLDAAGSAAKALFSLQRTEFALQRSGVTYETYTLEDFAAIDREYDVYIFPDAFYVPAAQRGAIRRKLAQDGATAIWLYAPGYIDEEGCGLAGVEALCGLKLGVEHGNAVVQVEKPDGHAPLFADVGSFGSGAVARSYTSDLPLDRYVPEYDCRTLPATFYCDDPEAQVLATLESCGRAGMARKQVEGFTSIWIGAPEVPWPLWRTLLSQAGVHVYSRSGDFLMANDRFVALYCITAGPKRIDLPRRCTVTDALLGETVATNAGAFSFHGRAGETASYILHEE